MRRTLNYIYKITKPFYLYIIFMLICTLMWGAYLSSQSYTLKYISESLSIFVGKNNINFYDVFNIVKKPIFIFLFYLFAVSILFRLNDILIKGYMFPRMRKNSVSALFEEVFKNDYKYFIVNTPQKICEKIKDFSDYICTFYEVLFEEILENAVFAIIVISSMIYFKLKIYALLLGIWIISFLIFYAIKIRKLIFLSSNFIKSSTENKNKINDIFINKLSVFLSNSFKDELSKINIDLSTVLKNESLIQFEYAKIWAFYVFSFLFFNVLTLYLILKDFASGKITLGDISFIWVIFLNIVSCVWKIAVGFSSVLKSFSIMNESINFIVQNENKTLKIISNEHIPKFKSNEIEIKNLSFSYNNQQKIFNNFSLKIQENEKVGIVGYSGSGKTTLVNLILGLYDFKDGEIIIGGVNNKEVSKEILQKQFSVIPQSPILFSRSIKENIKYGNENATMDDIIDAAKKVNLHDFIMNLEDKYETVLGEGTDLSGGQKQRLIIARMFIRNAPILILDEATSSLDAINEALIKDSINELMQNKTAIVIAHKLSTIMHLDKIVVMEKGKIKEIGTHNELLSKNGLYAELWNIQSDSFLKTKK